MPPKPMPAREVVTVADFTQVVPGKVYGVPDVAAVMDVHPNTVLAWIARGRLKTLPRVTEKASHRILGATLIGLLGDQAASLELVKGETVAERQARVNSALADIRRLAKPPGQPAKKARGVGV